MEALRDEPKSDETGRVDKNEDNQDSKSDKDHPFSLNDLREEWKNFVGSIDAPQIKSALSAREPMLTENWNIEYELDTELQQNRITNDFKPKLLGFLRRQFKNDAIEIQFKVSVDAGQQPHIPYTDAERWNSLVERYPALADLKSKFGLDFEHF